MQGLCTAKQVHTGQKARKTQEMVAMQMAYKNMVNTLESDGELAQLHLGTFATINQKIIAGMLYYLGGWMPAKSRCGRTATKDSNFKNIHG
jgi:hypothetical protein